jgi:hypothetical protein
MKKVTTALLLLTAAALLLSGGAVGKPPKAPNPNKPATPAKPAKAQPHPNHASWTIGTVDANACGGGTWSTDSVKRTVKVHQLTGGATPTYRVKIQDRGAFTTTGGVSPGDCTQNHSKHGTTVAAGKIGKVKGSITGTVTGGVFNPTGFNPATTCTGAAPCTTAAFVAAAFGGGAQFSCLGDSRDCKVNYKYKAANDQGLVFHRYHLKAKGAGTFAAWHVTGDIAGA